MAVKVGSGDISAAYVGSTACSAIYVGSTQVWSARTYDPSGLTYVDSSALDWAANSSPTITFSLTSPGVTNKKWWVMTCGMFTTQPTGATSILLDTTNSMTIKATSQEHQSEEWLMMYAERDTATSISAGSFDVIVDFGTVNVQGAIVMCGYYDDKTAYASSHFSTYKETLVGATLESSIALTPLDTDCHILAISTTAENAETTTWSTGTANCTVSEKLDTSVGGDSFSCAILTVNADQVEDPEIRSLRTGAFNSMWAVAFPGPTI